MAKIWAWIRFPLLYVLAVVAWLMPLSAIVTPATLSIQSAQILPAPSSLQTVPSLAFQSLQFVGDMPLVQSNATNTLSYAYAIPGQEVIEVVKAVAAMGNILPIIPPSPNASWAIDFEGPTLTCSNVSDSLRSDIVANVWSATVAASSNSQCAAYGYVSWLEGLPFVTNGPQYTFNDRIFSGNSMPAILYLAAFPNAMSVSSNDSLPTSCLGTNSSSTALANAVIIQCQLATSNYRVAFEYANGIPSISASSQLQDDSLIQTVSAVNCTISSSNEGFCDLSSTIMRTLSYQAIMDAFTYLITGYIVANGKAPIASPLSQVISTPLASTEELQFITQSLESAVAEPLQQTLLKWTNTQNEGLVKIKPNSLASSLPHTIEEFFKNATISMMSQTQLRPNISSSFAMAPVNVTNNIYHNVYSYSAYKLWIAYGIAIIISIAAALLGLIAVATTGASYSSSNQLSSTFRFAVGATLSASIRDEDLDGRDPLPAHLASAKVWPQQPLAASESLTRLRSITRVNTLDERLDGKSASFSASLEQSETGETTAKM